jgi:Skp family chaperone for outer membrane proteins
MKAAELKKKRLVAKKDVDAVIKKHGFESVKYVVARRVDAERLKRQLAAEKKRLTGRIQEIEAKLKTKGAK